MTCQVITFGNFKGGTGKTSNSTLSGIEFARRGYKTLLLDLDPQANATNLYLKTKENVDKKVVTFNSTLMSGIQHDDLKSTVINVLPNLDLLPSSADFALYPRFMETKIEDYNGRVKYLSKLLRPFKDEYDLIIIDTPPTISIITDSALYASDYCVIVLQTQERSLQGAEAFIKYIQEEIINTFKAPTLDVWGILPVLLKKRVLIDTSTLAVAREKFGSETILKTTIKNMERIKRYDVTGVTFDDQFDRAVQKVYSNVADDIIERIRVTE